MNCSRQPKVGRVFAVGEAALVFGTVDGFLLLENVNKNVLIFLSFPKLSMTQLTFSVDVRCTVHILDTFTSLDNIISFDALA